MTFDDGVRLIQARAEAMEEAAALADSCMASVSGVDDDTLTQLLAAAAEQVGNGGKAYIANYMFPEGRTCSGDTAVLKKLCELISSLVRCSAPTNSGLAAQASLPTSPHLLPPHESRLSLFDS